MRRIAFSRELVLVCLILFIAALFRFPAITTRPGYDWDEPVYTSIEQNLEHLGYPEGHLQGDEIATPYLYHPPFDFYLKAAWFKVTGHPTIGSARILSGIESMALLFLIYLLVKSVSGKNVALIALLITACDGWMIYTNRIAFIENAMMPLGVFGLLLYARALKRGKQSAYVLAGAVIGFAGVYKHTGIYFLLVPIIYLFITRTWRTHIALIVSVFATYIVYFMMMVTIWGRTYLDQSGVQILRTFGKRQARGLNYGPETALTAVTAEYWLFFTTILLLAGGTLVILYRLYQFIRYKEAPASPLLFSWAVAGLLFLAIVALRAPHYLIVILVPYSCYIASEITVYQPLLRKQTTWAALAVFLVLACSTWMLRFGTRSDNALRDTASYVAANIPSGAKVLTEESIGTEISQPYYKLDTHQAEGDLIKLQPGYIILYYSHTQRPPNSDALNQLVNNSQLVKRIIGFKEDIRVYRVITELGETDRDGSLS